MGFCYWLHLAKASERVGQYRQIRPLVNFWLQYGAQPDDEPYSGALRGVCA
jgi:hypothetical protein